LPTWSTKPDVSPIGTQQDVQEALRTLDRESDQHVRHFARSVLEERILLPGTLRAEIEEDLATFVEQYTAHLLDNLQPFWTENCRVVVLGNSDVLATAISDQLLKSARIGDRTQFLVLEGMPNALGSKLIARVLEKYRAGASQHNTTCPAGTRTVPLMPEANSLLLVPDSSVVHLFSESARPCDFVLVGANAVTKQGSLVHAPGTLQLASLAQRFRVNVYSLSPSYKFGCLKRDPFSSFDLRVSGSASAGAAGLVSEMGTALATCVPSPMAQGAGALGNSVAFSAADPAITTTARPQPLAHFPTLTTPTGGDGSGTFGGPTAPTAAASPSACAAPTLAGLASGVSSPPAASGKFVAGVGVVPPVDLVPSSMVTYYITEGGIVLPWSVADFLTTTALRQRAQGL
jgi:translation initiation factor 2B subunit (eIF-2B alpha/beta/delta family)